MINVLRLTLCAGLLVFAAGCEVPSISEDINVPAGSTQDRGASTVNGNVSIGESAKTGGSFRTVNGNIRIGEGASVDDCASVNGSVTVDAGAETGNLGTVNGAMHVARDARIAGNIKLVNGGVSLARGSIVKGDVATVNGAIELQGSRVTGALSNFRGGMTITDGSVVEGNLTVRKGDGGDGNEELPRVVIGPDSKVLGKLMFERAVVLYVHETAETGPIDGASARRFSGSHPDIG